MTFNEYNAEAVKLDRNPNGPLWYPCLGLAGEVGEVIEPIKKWYRDGTEIKRKSLIGEMGDVLWYLNGIAHRGCRELGLDLFTLEDVAEANIEKLKDRAKYGKRT